MNADEQFKPEGILRLGLGFWGAKTLLSAVSLGLFTELAKGPLDDAALSSRLGLHPRGARDFFDALTSLGLLVRRGALYSNSPEADAFLDRAKPAYVGGLLEMADARLYPVWGLLTEALRTGRPQNEAREESDYYGKLCDDEARLRTFLHGMTGLNLETSKALARKFPWGQYRTFLDLGGAHGVLSARLAEAHGHLSGGSFDLPGIGPFFDEYVAPSPAAPRLRFHAGDFFADALPPADVLIMGHVLHNWNLAQKQLLIRKAYETLREGGVLLVYDALIDPGRRENTFGLLMSLNMLLVTAGGCVYTGPECESWMREAGFGETRVEHLTGPDSMVIATK